MRYLAALESLSYEFVRLVAEALGLAPDGLARFYDAPERMQHRSKVRICKFSRRDGPAGLIYISQDRQVPKPRPGHVRAGRGPAL